MWDVCQLSSAKLLLLGVNGMKSKENRTPMGAFHFSQWWILERGPWRLVSDFLESASSQAIDKPPSGSEPWHYCLTWSWISCLTLDVLDFPYRCLPQQQDTAQSIISIWCVCVFMHACLCVHACVCRWGVLWSQGLLWAPDPPDPQVLRLQAFTTTSGLCIAGDESQAFVYDRQACFLLSYISSLTIVNVFLLPRWQ